MEAEVERVKGAPGDEPSFRAYDMNEALSSGARDDLLPGRSARCFVDELPARAGPAYLGFDFGEATSSTAATAIWPQTGRVEFWMSFGDVPPLADRQRRDSAPYVAMEARGELRTYPGRVVRPEAFLGDLLHDLAGVRVAGAAADSYKDSEVKDFLDHAGIRWPIDFRRVGAGKDGGADVRSVPTAGDPEAVDDVGVVGAVDGDIQVNAAQGRQRQSGHRSGYVARADRPALVHRDRVRSR